MIVFIRNFAYVQSVKLLKKMSIETLLHKIESSRLEQDQRKRKLGLSAKMTQDEFNGYINELVKADTLSQDVFEEYNVDFCWRCGRKFDGNYYTHRINLERVHSKKVNPIKRVITTELKDLTINECSECHNIRVGIASKCDNIIKALMITILLLFVGLTCLGIFVLHWDWTYFFSIIFICVFVLGIVQTIGRPIVEIFVNKKKKESANCRNDAEIPIVKSYLKSGYGIES